MKYGLWENGRRIKWLEREEVAKIEEGDCQYKDNFKDPNSLEIANQKLGFNPPHYFRFKQSLAI